MKKMIAFLLSIIICTTTLVEAKPKKINKVRELVKGTTALVAAVGLICLAYKAPLNEIKAEITKIKNQLTNQGIFDGIIDSVRSMTAPTFNYIKGKIYGEGLDQAKIFSLITMLPVLELAKYGICRIALSIQSPEEVCCEEMKRSLKKKKVHFQN